MPVQGKPQIRPPYWQMPQKLLQQQALQALQSQQIQQAKRPMTKQEYCAICELKDLVSRLGQNLCTPNCTSCDRGDQIGRGGFRPATAMPTIQRAFARVGDAIPPPLTPRAYPPQPRLIQQQPPQGIPAEFQGNIPVTTYQWPQYTTGTYWPPPEEQPAYMCQNRPQPYLPVKISLPSEATRNPRYSKSGNILAKQSAELRASVMVGCECTKKNGLQDTCPKVVCQDMIRVGVRENPTKLPCKVAPCKGEIILEDEDFPENDDKAKKDSKEIPVKDVCQKPASPKCKPECDLPCKERKK